MPLIQPRLQVAIIGAGKIAGYNDSPENPSFKTHISVLKKNPNYNIIGIVDTKTEQAKNFALRWNVRAFESIKSLCESKKPDIFIICTSPESHFQVIEEISKLIDHPVQLLVEKPLCLLSTELKRIQILTHTKAVRIIVNHSRRFDDRFIKLKRDIKRLELGNPIKIYASYYGGWFSNAIHHIDTIEYLFSSKIKWEKAKSLATGRGGSDVLICASGNLARFRECSVEFIPFDEKYYQVFDLDIFFSAGRVSIRNFEDEFFLYQRDTNHLNENFLKRIDVTFNQENTSMENLYEKAHEFFSKSEANISPLNDISYLNSTETLIEGYEKHEENL